MRDGSSTSDNVETDVQQADAQPDRKEYRVVSEAGLLKRGKQYKEGDIVELDEKTTAAFLEAGDIEETK